MTVYELIYSTLAGDATLKALLGGSASDSHIYPIERGLIAVLPAVGMRVVDGPADASFGITRPAVDFMVASKTSSAEVVSISDRIKALLHSKTLRGTGLVIHIAKQTSSSDDFDPEAQEYIRDLRYSLIAQ